MSYPTSMDYDLGVNPTYDATQPASPIEQGQSPAVGGGSASTGSGVGGLKVAHAIVIIFIVSLLIYSGAAYVVFRKINRAI
jgi:hypothetical protein